jgi:hypothetical protein
MGAKVGGFNGLKKAVPYLLGRVLLITTLAVLVVIER